MSRTREGGLPWLHWEPCWVTAILWGFLGSVPTKVQGQGILIKSGGVFEVVSVGGGQVIDVAIEVGEEVSEGQVVARIAQPQLREEIQQTKANLRELQSQYNTVRNFGSQDLRLQADYLEQQRTSLGQSIPDLPKSAWSGSKRRSIARSNSYRKGSLPSRPCSTPEKSTTIPRSRLSNIKTSSSRSPRKR